MSWHVGHVIRELRNHRRLSATDLARLAGCEPELVERIERDGPEVEETTPEEWQALDRIAAALGLSNGAALYRLVPDPAPASRPAAARSAASGGRVVPFPPRPRRGGTS